MLEALKNIVQAVNSAQSFDETLNVIINQVKEVMDAGVCSIYLYNPRNNSYHLTATEGLNPDVVGEIVLGPKEGLVGMVAGRAEPINLEKADTHPQFAFFPESGELGFSAFLGAPIIHQRNVLGVLVVQHQKKPRFDESEESFLVTISAQLASVIAHARATGELEQRLNPNQPLVSERLYHGVASAPGVAIGSVVVIAPAADLHAVPDREADDHTLELQRFHTAMAQTKQDLAILDSSMLERLSDEERALFDAYIRMLDDHALGAEVVALIEQGLSAQSAWAKVMLSHVHMFKTMQDAYLRERAADVEDLGRRVLAHLQQSAAQRTEFPDKIVMVGEELSAASFADVPMENVVAIVSLKGSRNSHLAILGRAIGIPTVMGVVDLPWTRLDDYEMVVDGHNGQVVVSPSQPLRQMYLEQIHEEQLLAADLEKLVDSPCLTSDGHKLSLWVNTGLRIDSMLSLDRGAEGVGLYRTEIPFLMLDRFPSEEEQRKAYREHLELFAPRTVTMRTLDIGGDKSLPYFPIEEANPFLGWRGIRVCLDHPDIFLVQLRAMMRASEGLNNLSILLPMISGIPELEAALTLVYRVYDELTLEEGFQIDMPHVGAMIEVPAAVHQIREVARRVDFLSVGTNDLVQYMLAVDRNNPRVASLYSVTHPSILRALSTIAEGAKAEDTPVSVCGEMAGDPIGAVLLMGLGYRVLSMSATNLLKIKAVLRQVSLVEAQQLVAQALEMPDADSVWRHLQAGIKKPEIAALFSKNSDTH